MPQLTEHFTFEDLTCTDHREFDNTPTEHEACIIGGQPVVVNALANLPRLAEFLEQVRTLLGDKPIMVNSAFRSNDVNAAVGSSGTSDHRRGCAADIRVVGMTPDQVCRALIASNLGFQQVIREFDRWTHVSIPTIEGAKANRQALIIDKQTPKGRPFA